VFSVDSEYSDVFATCSKNDIRVWNTETSLELLRISVPNFTCTGVQFSCNGKSIISGKFCTGYCMMRVVCYEADIGLIFWRVKLSPVV
jgi:WD40 repeat protein